MIRALLLILIFDLIILYCVYGMLDEYYLSLVKERIKNGTLVAGSKNVGEVVVPKGSEIIVEATPIPPPTP